MLPSNQWAITVNATPAHRVGSEYDPQYNPQTARGPETQVVRYAAPVRTVLVDSYCQTSAPPSASCLPIAERYQCAMASVQYSEDEHSIGIKTFLSEETTMHGIKYVVLPGARITIKRVLWTLVFALFWVYFISVSVKKVQYYYSFQHITQVDEESKELNFPAITICNLNPIRLSAFTKSDLYQAGRMYQILSANLTLKEDLFSSGDETAVALRSKTDFTEQDKRVPFDLEEFQLRAGHKMKDMLKACKWRDQQCTEKDFQPVLTEMGLCYQFNSNKSLDPETGEYAFRKVYKGGAGNGLKLLLVTQEQDYLPPNIEDFDSTLETGFKIEVHDPDVPPLVHQLGIGLAPGLQTFVVLQKEEVNYLSEPWGSCIDPMEPGKVTNFTKYSDPACRIECETEHIVQECECRMPFMPILPAYENSKTVCSPAQIIKCARSALARIEDGEACGPETCIKSCRISRYTSSLSSVKFPSFLGAIKLQEEFPDTFPTKKDVTPANESSAAATSAPVTGKWKETIDGAAAQKKWEQALVVSIYFQSLSLQKIEQVEAYDFPAMLGDIGGLMGLFIGASAMTLFEFLFFFCDSLILRRKSTKQPPPDTPSQSSPSGGQRKVVHAEMDNGKFSMPPGAVDGSKFVINFNPDYNPGITRVLPQFTAHPLHNSFQQQQQPQQQQPRGYSPLMKRAAGNFGATDGGDESFGQQPAPAQQPQFNTRMYQLPNNQPQERYC